MNPNFKIGDGVSTKIKGKPHTGKVFVADYTDKGWRYDVRVEKPEEIIIKHAYENQVKEAAK